MCVETKSQLIVFAGYQVSSCYEESGWLSDSFNGEAKGGDDGFIRVN